MRSLCPRRRSLPDLDGIQAKLVPDLGRDLAKIEETTRQMTQRVPWPENPSVVGPKEVLPMGDVIDRATEWERAQRRSASPLLRRNPSMSQVPAAVSGSAKLDVLELENVAASAPLVEAAPLKVKSRYSGGVHVTAPKVPAVRLSVSGHMRSESLAHEVIRVERHHVARIGRTDPVQPLIQLPRFVSKACRYVGAWHIEVNRTEFDSGMSEVEVWDFMTDDHDMKARMRLGTDGSQRSLQYSTDERPVVRDQSALEGNDETKHASTCKITWPQRFPT